ncbi:zinc finger protein 391-like [Battus philenor]|uniref:zinc finger protein 391-like n=1 Tax=Battus philenor TaxID=42288 RepID=UPI0035D07AC6
MDDCRICLKCKGDKDISKLDIERQGKGKSFLDIMLFCLDIVAQDCKVATKLCLKCYKKIIAFEKFKSLALKNDAYLQTINVNVDIKNEIFLIDEIKCEDKLNDNDLSNNNESDFKEDVKEEEGCELVPSDDELLNVINQMKHENGSDASEENAQDQIMKTVLPKNEKKLIKDNDKQNQICDECGKTVRNLKEHLARHQSINERKCIKCKVCDKLFSSYSARYRHHKVKHLGIKPHCDICNKGVSNLRAHHLVVHNTEELPFKCVPCGRRFISQSTLDMHTTVHTKDRPYSCDQCDKKFRNKITMIQHKRQVHDKERSYLCQFCSKSFFKKYHLQEHLRSHTKEKPFQCSECKKWYSSRTSLKTHQLIHNDVKMIGCTLCDMTFSKPDYLRNHMIIHTKEKRHSCKYCGVRFGRSDHRKRHEFTAHERNLEVFKNIFVS